MNQPESIRPRVRDAILQSLRAGVVPSIGQQHIQVGRASEVAALVKDIDRVAEGGSAFRLVVGEYGAGKTFFLQLIRSIALEKKLVCLHADLNPDRRIHATGGQARSLYQELTRNAATRAKAEGGALTSVVERFITHAMNQAKESNTSPENVIRQQLESLNEMVGGYDFAEVMAAYWRGHDTENEALKSNAVRWLRGEFSTKTEARAALGVRVIVEDATIYDHLKLLAKFMRLAGFNGLLVCLDELVNLYKMANSRARNSNYEQILRILNDCLQGSVAGLGIILGGTPEFVTDTRRGLYSYAALQTRLAQNSFATNGLIDLSGPVIRLTSLTPEDLYVLLTKLRHVYAAGDRSAYLLPDEALAAFMDHCSKRVGDAYFRTPRSTITAFINLLAVLEQNRAVAWSTLVERVDIARESAPDTSEVADEGDGDDLASFKL